MSTRSSYPSYACSNTNDNVLFLAISSKLHLLDAHKTKRKKNCMTWIFMNQKFSQSQRNDTCEFTHNVALPFATAFSHLMTSTVRSTVGLAQLPCKDSMRICNFPSDSVDFPRFHNLLITESFLRFMFAFKPHRRRLSIIVIVHRSLLRLLNWFRINRCCYTAR